MINILPKEMRRRALLDYRMRFVAVAMLTASAALAVGTALLIPSYFKAWVARTDLVMQSSIADQSLVQPNLAAAVQIEKNAAGVLTRVREQSAALRPTVIVDALLSVRKDGISVRHIEYRTDDEGMAKVKISGIASKRENLLSFKQALQAASGVKSVELPADTYAASVNVPFLLTVNIAGKEQSDPE